MDQTRQPFSLDRTMLINDAAQILGVSRRTVYYRIRAGRLRTIRTRGGSQRVLWSSIDALIREVTPDERCPPDDYGQADV